MQPPKAPKAPKVPKTTPAAAKKATGTTEKVSGKIDEIGGCLTFFLSRKDRNRAVPSKTRPPWTRLTSWSR